MKKLFNLITIIILFTACKQNISKETANEITTETTPIVADTAIANVEQQTPIAVQDNIQVQTDILNKWLAETIGCDFPVDLATIKNANFNSFNYKKKASSTFINRIEFKKNGKRPKISSSNKLITIDFTGDEGLEIFFAEENRFTYSHHLSAGSNGGSIVYDLITQKVKDYPFTFQSINNDIADISQDGYGGVIIDFDENGKPIEGGHFWQKGKLNMVTGNITWGTKEY